MLNLMKQTVVAEVDKRRYYHPKGQVASSIILSFVCDQVDCLFSSNGFGEVGVPQEDPSQSGVKSIQALGESVR